MQAQFRSLGIAYVSVKMKTTNIFGEWLLGMKQTFAVIGLGRFGGSLLESLIAADQEVLAIDNNPTLVENYMDVATHAVIADAQDEDALRDLDLPSFDHVIVAIGEDIQASILVTLMAKEMGVPKITAKAQDEYHARVLDKVGADTVVHPERDMGIRLGHKLTSNNMLDFIELSEDYSLAEIMMTHKKFYNKTIEEINFRKHFNVTIVAIRRGKNELIVSPPANQLIIENDILLVVGHNQDVDYLDEKTNH